MAQYKPKIGQFWADSLPKNFLKLFDNDFTKIQSKIDSKRAQNWPNLGPKKPAGLSGCEDRASGGLGPPKKPFGRAGFGLSPRPDPSLSSSKYLFSTMKYLEIKFTFLPKLKQYGLHLQRIVEVFSLQNSTAS